MLRAPLVLFLLWIAACCCCCNAFSVIGLTSSTTKPNVGASSDSLQLLLLWGVIRPESVDFDFDVGQGGVRLATESVVKLSGKVIHKPGSADPNVSELIRYSNLAPVDDKIVQKALAAAAGATIIATGRGTERYQDPGSTTEAIVIHAPSDAVRDCLVGAGSAMPFDTVVVNFCGGDDAQVLEVMEAIRQLVLALDVATKAKISFHSISHSNFPLSSSAVTIIGLSEGASTGGLEGVERAIASGELYFRDGKYYTLVEQDINPAIA